MKVLLDENVDAALLEFMPGHDVSHVVRVGWQGMKNGQLLSKTQEAGYDVLVTADKNMPYQQNLGGRSFALVVLDIHPNALMNQIACVPALEERLLDIQAGKVYVIVGPHSRRKG